MLSEKELLNILDNKEKVNVEFKEAKRGVPKSIYETYSSFANTNGGLIILGVKEIKTGTAVNYEISGVENANSIISDFWNTINSGKVNRNILKDADVYSLTVQGLELVILHIPRALYNQKPIYIGSNPYAGTFKRNFEGDYRCTKESVNSMIRDSFQNAGDNEILEWLNIGDLDKNTIAVYRTRFRNNNEGHIYEELSDKDFLTKMGAYRFDKKRNIEGVTSAGVLMFGKTETFNEIYHKSTRHFPACSHNFPKAGEARFQGLSRLFRLLGKFPYLGESRRILMAVSSKTSSKTRFYYAATRRISSAAVQPSIWA